MTDISIRPVNASDIPAITHIYAHAVLHGTASFEIEPPDAAEMARRMQALLTNNYPYIVAESAGAVAGYAYAGAYRTRPAYHWSVEDSVYVAPDSHRGGIGLLLLRELVDIAEARGFRQMIAVIGDSAQAASIALHSAIGFRHVGVLPSTGFKHGRWLDSVLMQRALGSGDTTPP
jgi:phosphinothricin acetyltransferase